MACHDAVDGRVRAVHVVPLVDDAAVLEPLAMAANIPLLYATWVQSDDDGIVLAVQVVPSVEDAATLLLTVEIATKTPLPKVVKFHLAAVIVLAVHVVPFVDDAADVEPAPVATIANTPLP